MGDMGDDFRAMKVVSGEKKSGNKKFSTKMLSDNGIDFESKNGGVHLIVNADGPIIDFWPSTGKFICRKTGRESRGVKKLIKHVDNLKELQQSDQDKS